MKPRKRSIRLLLLLALILGAFSWNTDNLHAQTWPMPGATWEYCITGWNGMPAGHLILGLKGDTIINNRAYRIIGTISESGWNGNRSTSALMTIYTRFSNDSVYRFVNNREYLYFNFNSSDGNVFSTFRSAGHYYNWNDSACTSILPLKTIGTDMLSLNGMQLRRSILRDTLFKTIYNVPDEDEVEYTLVERIGILNGLPLINSREPAGFGYGCSLPSDYASYTLGSYSDDEFFAVQFLNCEGVGIKDISNVYRVVKAYPNPATDYIVFEVQNSLPSGTITISDHTGRPVTSFPLNGEKTLWQTTGIKPGVYLYRLQTKEGSASGKLLIAPL